MSDEKVIWFLRLKPFLLECLLHLTTTNHTQSSVWCVSSSVSVFDFRQNGGERSSSGHHLSSQHWTCCYQWPHQLHWPRPRQQVSIDLCRPIPFLTCFSL